MIIFESRVARYDVGRRHEQRAIFDMKKADSCTTTNARSLILLESKANLAVRCIVVRFVKNKPRSASCRVALIRLHVATIKIKSTVLMGEVVIRMYGTASHLVYEMKYT